MKLLCLCDCVEAVSQITEGAKVKCPLVMSVYLYARALSGGLRRARGRAREMRNIVCAFLTLLSCCGSRGQVQGILCIRCV